MTTNSSQGKPTPGRKPGHFEICAEMCKRNLDIRLSTLDNITNLQYQKRTEGTLVTIGVDGNLVGAIGIDNKFVGGLLLCDKKQYFALADELAGRKP